MSVPLALAMVMLSQIANDDRLKAQLKQRTEQLVEHATLEVVDA